MRLGSEIMHLSLGGVQAASKSPCAAATAASRMKVEGSANLTARAVHLARSESASEEQFHFFDAFPVSGSPHDSTSEIAMHKAQWGTCHTRAYAPPRENPFYNHMITNSQV
jgi:hypothetical protein